MNYFKENKSVPIQEKFCIFVISNMLQILFGDVDTSKEEMLKLFDYLTFCVVNVEIKVLNVEMDEATEKEIKEKITYVHDFVKLNIRKRMAMEVTEKTCLVDWLKAENNEDVVFTDGMTFFFGSIHTTISNLAFTVFHLANNPEKQMKLQEELDAKLANKEIDAKSIKECKYLRACINEGLRLTPPVSTSSRIDSKNDITLPDGLVIPKNTPIITPLGLVLLHEELWRDPKKYNPERFREDGILFANQFSPFGFAGGRVCPGKALAHLEIQFMIANLFKHFNVKLAKGQGPLNLHYLTGTTTKDEIFVDVTPRY
jgi:cytochrome P450